MLFRSGHEPATFRLPRIKGVSAWTRQFDTENGWARDQTPLKAGDELEVPDRCFMALRHEL